ncbi:MAG: hypothetical protein IKD18_05795 [Clostridia bacterium]|nr:hypothetical protein [Clostridia bacterium]
MTVSEKVAYLNGMMEGLDFQADTKEAKLIKLMADILEDVALELTECQDDIDDINEYMEAMDEDLTNVEEELFGEFDDEDEGCCCCDECDDEDCYEVDCPHCGETVCFEEAPEAESFPCPACEKDIPLN